MHSSMYQVGAGFDSRMMEVSSGLPRASIVKAMNDDEGVDKDAAGEILLEVLLTGRVYLGKTRHLEAP
jgi:hypothetical protein